MFERKTTGEGVFNKKVISLRDKGLHFINFLLNPMFFTAEEKGVNLSKSAQSVKM